MRFIRSVLCATVCAFLVGCGSSDSSSTTNPATTNQPTAISGSLSISSSANSNVFAANVGEIATNTYQFTASTSDNSPYSISVSGLGDAMSVASNSCQNVASSSSCTIAIQFAPTPKTQYSNYINLNFTTNIALLNSQNISVVTVPSTLDFNTTEYHTGSYKYGIMTSIGGSAPILSEIDTGSPITVVNADAVGPNIIKTNQPLSITYGGNRTVTGYLAYGSISLTASNGTTITTSPNTPLLIATDNNTPDGPNQALLGVELNNQVSMRLYLPYPYNQMMLINFPNNKITFGTFNKAQMQKLGSVQLNPTQCSNIDVNSSLTNTCWNDRDIQVKYNFDDLNTSVYSTVFDTGGSNHSNFELPNQPIGWNTNPTASLVTSRGVMSIPLSLPAVYSKSSANKVNSGAYIFQVYQVLYNQIAGTIGLLDANSSF